MALSKIPPPPISGDADSLTVKKWFNDVYKFSKGGILVPFVDGTAKENSGIHIYGRRNILHNGAFQVCQRGHNTTFTSTGAQEYFIDRWMSLRSAGTQLTSHWADQTTIYGFPRYVRVARAAADATTASFYLVQALETVDVRPLAGQQVTLSFWARFGTKWAGTAGFFAPSPNATFMGRVETGTGTDLGPFAAFPGSATGPIVAIAPTADNTWQYYQATGTISTTATCLKMYFQWVPPAVAAGDANHYVDIAGVQLEIGTQATAFDQRTFAEDLRVCQRYYSKSFTYAQTPIPASGTYTGAVQYVAQRAGALPWMQPVFFPVPMRTQPTVTAMNPIVNTANWRNASLGVDSAAFQASQIGESGFTAWNTQVAGDAVNSFILCHWTATADL